jgi:hypothetical protein
VLIDRGLDLITIGLIRFTCSLQGFVNWAMGIGQWALMKQITKIFARCPIPHAPKPQVFLVLIARWNHTEPIPNSEVKRCCGDDSLGVALRQNSSMPGLIITQRKPPFSDETKGVFVYAEFSIWINRYDSRNLGFKEVYS